MTNWPTLSPPDASLDEVSVCWSWVRTSDWIPSKRPRSSFVIASKLKVVVVILKYCEVVRAAGAYAERRCGVESQLGSKESRRVRLKSTDLTIQVVKTVVVWVSLLGMCGSWLSISVE